MTHGGLLGSSEAAFCGVPVISTPFYGDQFMNSAAMEERGMGVILKYQDMNKDSVFQALRKALDVKVRDNARKVSYSYTHRPMKPKDSVVFWSEYVIATKGAPLARPHAADAHWIIYSMLDIYVFILVALWLGVYSWIYLWRKVFGKALEDPKKTPSSYRDASMERKIK
jgi:glucuronosyltransferase